MLIKQNKFFIKYFYLSIFVSFIFLFDVKYGIYQLRFSILLLLLPSLIFFLKDYKNKNFTFLKYVIFFSFLIFIHLYINIFIDGENLTLRNIFVFGFSISLFTISYYFFDFLNKNILNLIILFVLLFLLSSLTNFYDFKYSAPYFCGGIPDVFKLLDYDTYVWGENIFEKDRNNFRENSEIYSQAKFSFKEYLFIENSHLGMIVPGILAYILNYLFTNKSKLIYRILFSVFILICFLKSSTTFLVGAVISLFILILFNYKYLNLKVLISYSLIICLFSYILVTDKECNSRFVSIYGSTNLNIVDYERKKFHKKIFQKNSWFGTEDQEKKITNQDNINQEKKILDKNFSINISNTLVGLFNTTGNLSSAIYFHALSIAKNSFFERPYGWGINRYEKAFIYHNNNNSPKNERLNNYNSKDGTNNFVKIIVEFGFFGILIYFFIFLFLINPKIPYELKLFYLPIIITQSIRGAGYFNGGFMLIVFLMIFTYINLYKKLR